MKRLTLRILFALVLSFFLFGCSDSDSGGGSGGGDDVGNGVAEFPSAVTNFQTGGLEISPVEEVEPNVFLITYSGVYKTEIDTMIAALEAAGFAPTGSQINGGDLQQRAFAKIIGYDTVYYVAIAWSASAAGQPGVLALTYGWE
ncbi:MAG: hypothetical protein LBV04_05515 [Deferribacteraceae bacterium]|jgi:hypothetical protein|nr:hypothetical protein [Deferribacteraceae bacterium]